MVGGEGLELCPGQLEGVGVLALQLPGLAPLHPGQAAQGHHGPELQGQLQLVDTLDVRGGEVRHQLGFVLPGGVK